MREGTEFREDAQEMKMIAKIGNSNKSFELFISLSNSGRQVIPF